ncbi:adenosine deaminase-like [Homalodisca vitripennis]|uniref:adenosine deaminase-like n=1 Tax=Homalodisca vitripennis TaxID=197043 RepID=UPI001EEA63B8|nr:adenosine deaminase-like [Homalodisca vitripennis]
MEPTIPRKKIQLHLHLDGSVRPSTAWELAQEKGIKIPGVTNFEEFKKACIVSNPSNLWGFLQHFGVFWPAFCGDLDALERNAYEFCEDAQKNGVIYAEVRYSPTTSLGDKAFKVVGPLGYDEVIRRISFGLKRGEHDFGVKTRTILCGGYCKESNDLYQTLRLCQAHYYEGVVGMDLLTLQQEHGIIEEAPLVEPIISVYQEAARTGVHRTVHAAEASGAHSVQRAVYGLGSERIGHGYHVLEEPEIYNKCLQDRIHFECCPYSSLLTGSVKTGGKTHPIIRFANDRANFSISADDPTVTGHHVQDDYALLANWGLSEDLMAQANLNAAYSSFLDDHGKHDLLKTLKEDYAR